MSPGRGFPRYVPAFLSSIIPGLGQLVTGRRTLAALFLFPVVVGGGKRALPDDVRAQLELIDERRFGSGVVHLHYRVGE